MQYEINNGKYAATFRPTVINIIKKYIASSNTNECSKFIMINNTYAHGKIVYDDMHADFTDKFIDLTFTQGNYKIDIKINQYKHSIQLKSAYYTNY